MRLWWQTVYFMLTDVDEHGGSHSRKCTSNFLGYWFIGCMLESKSKSPNKSKRDVAVEILFAGRKMMNGILAAAQQPESTAKVVTMVGEVRCLREEKEKKKERKKYFLNLIPCKQSHNNLKKGSCLTVCFCFSSYRTYSSYAYQWWSLHTSGGRSFLISVSYFF